MSKFDPEDFYEIWPSIVNHDRFGINQLSRADTRRSSNLNITLFTRNFNALLVSGRALIMETLKKYANWENALVQGVEILMYS